MIDGGRSKLLFPPTLDFLGFPAIKRPRFFFSFFFLRSFKFVCRGLRRSNGCRKIKREEGALKQWVKQILKRLNGGSPFRIPAGTCATADKKGIIEGGNEPSPDFPRGPFPRPPSSRGEPLGP